MAQSRALGSRISDVLAKVENDLEEIQKQFLINIAEDLVAPETSPIWSGQYITSHSISTSSSAGQFTGNVGEGGWTEKTSVPEAYRSEARANLMSDIANLPPLAEKIYINNNAPHAQIVEYGGGRTRAHAVFSSVRNRAGLHLQTAINTVRGTR